MQVCGGTRVSQKASGIERREPGAFSGAQSPGQWLSHEDPVVMFAHLHEQLSVPAPPPPAACVSCLFRAALFPSPANQLFRDSEKDLSTNRLQAPARGAQNAALPLMDAALKLPLALRVSSGAQAATSSRPAPPLGRSSGCRRGSRLPARASHRPDDAQQAAWRPDTRRVAPQTGCAATILWELPSNCLRGGGPRRRAATLAQRCLVARLQGRQGLPNVHDAGGEGVGNEQRVQAGLRQRVRGDDRRPSNVRRRQLI